MDSGPKSLKSKTYETEEVSEYFLVGDKISTSLPMQCLLRDRNFYYCNFGFAVREDNDRIFKHFFKAMTIYVIMEPNLLIVESLTLHRYNLPLRESPYLLNI